MRNAFHIAARLSEISGGRKSHSMVAISSWSAALSVTVMLVAVSVIAGFKSEIRTKITDFSAAVQVVSAQHYAAYDTTPVQLRQPWMQAAEAMENIDHIVPFALCPGVIKADESIQGVVLKGMGGACNASFLGSALQEGVPPVFPDTASQPRIWLSHTVASALRLHAGDAVIMYFVQDPPRMRRFLLAGVFDTGIAELDKVYALTDLRHVQRLNSWDDGQVSGFEISVKNFKKLDNTVIQLFDCISAAPSGTDNLRIETVRERFMHIFDWLTLLNMNVLIILTLMLLVAGFNMISGLLILILERTRLIGLFKAMGASNRYLRRIFLYQACFIMCRGLLAGNAVALALCLLQKHTELIKLDQASYFVDCVPVAVIPAQWLAVNAAAAAGIWLMMQLPALLVARIEPARTIRYE